jgi:hypothetical protein
MIDIGFFNSLINGAIINLHTGYIAKVINVNGDTARVQPLTYTKDANGKNIEQAVVTAAIPPNVKYEARDIEYISEVSYSDSSGLKTETNVKQVLMPCALCPGDIVYCAVCERDITYALNGIPAESKRHHDMNDSIILKVL